MSMVGHDDLQSHHLLVSWFTYKQNKTKQSPFICGDPTPTPSYQASHLLLFINLSPVSSDKFERLSGEKNIHIHPYGLDGWCPGATSPKLPAKSGLFQGLKSTSLPLLFLIPPGEECCRLRENRFSRRRRKTTEKKPYQLGESKQSIFLKK